MTQSLNKDMARVIGAILMIRGIHRNAFAGTIGESTSNVSRWLKGGTFSSDKIEAMADAIGMQPDELVRLAMASRELDDLELVALVAQMEATRGRRRPDHQLRAVKDRDADGA